METTTYIALSRQLVLERNIEVIADNLANMTSSGFQAATLLVEPVPVDAGERQKLAFVQDLAVVRDLSPGNLAPTENPLDIAIDGPGYFVIDTAEGRRYGRGGQFSLNDQSEIVNAAGQRLLDDGGSPITLPLDQGEIAIAQDGTVSTATGVVARIDLVTFANEQALRKVGGGLYQTDQPTQPIENGRIAQGMLELANVRPIVEMTQMMATVRAYEGTQRLVDAHHEMQRQAIERMLQMNG
jgi:flagellar basal-body rod protein FlgF